VNEEKRNRNADVDGISVVIPCLNERDSIGVVVAAAIEGIAATGLPGEVIVVDNGCVDDSPAIAGKMGARVLLEKEQGYGAALRCGFSAAKYDVVVMGDGDLTYDFRQLSVLTQPIVDGTAEFVVGNRMKNIRPGAMSKLHRFIGNPMLSLTLRLLFRKHIVKDAHCGMRAITKAAYEKFGCVTTGMEFASEMIVRAIHCDVRMTERDIIYHPRVGNSKLRSFRDGWRHLRFMMLHSPTAVLLFPGIFFWLLGLAMMFPLVFGSVYVQGRSIDIHFMLLGGLLNIVSIQIITIGALAKAYAHLSGLRNDTFISWLYCKLNFEKATLFVSPLIIGGLVLIVNVIWKWVAGGCGSLNEARPLFFGIVCLANGVQIAAAAYLFSIMALPRHVDKMPSGSEKTGIPNL